MSAREKVRGLGLAVPETLTVLPPMADPTAGEEVDHPARNEKWMAESPGVEERAR